VYQKQSGGLEMIVGDMMSRSIAVCTEDTGLERVYELLRNSEHGVVIVVDSEAHRVPIGVVTERSICEQIIARGRNPRTLAAGSIMESRITKLRESDPVAKLAAPQPGVAAVIVIDEHRKVCGIVPEDKLSNLPAPIAATQSSNLVFINTNQRQTPAIREIPAFGWIQ
jgi:predicted transcriptional regulator